MLDRAFQSGGRRCALLACLIISATVGRAVAAPEDESWWGGFTGARRLGGWVYSLAAYDGRMVAGGEFTVAGDSTVVYNIAAWNGDAWEKLGSGLRHVPCPSFTCWPIVLVVLPFKGDLVAGGIFDHAGGGAAENIARWDGSSWHALGLGTNQAVWALAEYHGDLIVGGYFTQVGGEDANYIARWNGNWWSPLGSGLTRTVYALTVHNDTLIAGGSFDGRAAAWDGQTWRLMQEGTGAVVYDLGVFDGVLVAAGDFLDRSTSLYYEMARWTGREWVRFSGETDPREVADLAVFRGHLTAACRDGSVLRWNGHTWLALGTPGNDVVGTLCATDTSLYVGGRFTEIGGKPSIFIGRWDDPTTPVAVQDLVTLRSVDGVRVAWRLPAKEVSDIAGIEVWRAAERIGPYEQLTRSPLQPLVAMNFTDTSAMPNHQYWYRLLLVLQTGETEIAGPVGTGATTERERTELVSPSLATGGAPVAIRYRFADRGVPFRVEILSAAGHLIRVLECGSTTPGEHLRPWDQRALDGEMVPSGVYFVRLRAERDIARKLVLVH